MRALAVLLAGLLAAGCAGRVSSNPHLARVDAASGYRYDTLPKDGNGDDLFVILAFSGGGTRAAAFSYGVLEALRDARHTGGRPLLDDVDVISSVSGGSFTAAYYGLFRDAMFTDAGRATFLGEKIQFQGRLVARGLWPPTWFRLLSPNFDRIDLAAELYDETVFEGKTFSALAARPRPFVILHASSMANGAPFEFTQSEFDLLGSNLAAFPVARAVAASSAFPFLLSPVTLRSYPPPPGFQIPPEVTTAVEADRVSRELNPMRYSWGRHQLDLMSKKDDKGEWAPKWVHLLDGGLTDNIGLRSILRAYDRGFIRQRVNAGHIKRLVVIAVNARTDPPEQLSHNEKSPSLVDVFMKTATVSMENLSVDTLDYALNRQREREQAQTSVRVCNERLTVCRGRLLPTFAQEIRTCFVEISFEGLPAKQRDEFLALPTTFALRREQVDGLIKVAGTLLAESPDFQKLVRALRNERTLGAGAGDSGNCS